MCCPRELPEVVEARGRQARAAHGPEDIAAKLRARLALVRGKAEPDTPLELQPVSGVPGLRAVIPPRFLPAEARRRFREVFDHAELRIEVALPAPQAAGPRLVAGSVSERQHRRKTWAEKNAWNRLPEDAVVGIEARGLSELRLLLRLARPGASSRAAGDG